MISIDELKLSIKTEALALGFLLCGFTTPEPPQTIDIFDQWLEKNYHGEMNYLNRKDTRLKRVNARLLMPNVKSIVCLAFPYPSVLPQNTQNMSVTIAAYAKMKDYHKVIPEIVDILLKKVSSQNNLSLEWRCFTDSSPILEHDLAHRAGLGWIGKNSLLINPFYGSNFVLAEVMLNIPIEPDLPMAQDFCGTCRRCIENCPTQCIIENRTIDARQCISYLTIEKKGLISPEYHSSIGSHFFGCDICQQVCPWNQKAKLPDRYSSTSFDFYPASIESLIEFFTLDEGAFTSFFQDTPIIRLKRIGILRNACIVLGNSQSQDALEALRKFLTHEQDLLLLEQAAWAIQQLEIDIKHMLKPCE